MRKVSALHSRLMTATQQPHILVVDDDALMRELIAEYASIEDRLRSVEARVHGGSARISNPELLQPTEREREVLALLRRHRPTE